MPLNKKFAPAAAPGQDKKLFDAVHIDDAEAVARLLDEGVPVDTRNSHGDTPLMLAARRGAYAAAIALVGHGADQTAVNPRGQSALDFAERKGFSEFREILPNAPRSSANDETDPDAKGSEAQDATVANIAVTSVTPQSKLLLDAARNGFGQTVMLLAAKGQSLTGRDEDGKTMLHLAVTRRSEAFIRTLIDAGADINATDKESRSVLRAAMESGSAACVRLLLEAGAFVDNKSSDSRYGMQRDDDFARNCSPEVQKEVASAVRKFTLIEKAGEGDAETVEALLKEGVTPDAFDRKGERALTVACKKGDTQIVGMLLAHGAYPALCGNEATPPLFAAINGGSTKAVQMLFDAGISMKTKDAKGVLALDYACSGEATSEMERFVKDLHDEEMQSLAKGATQLQGQVMPINPLRFKPKGR